MPRPLAALRRGYHLAALLDAFLTGVRAPDAEAALRMERHAAALAPPEATARHIAALLADAPTRELLRDRWVPPRRTVTELLAHPDGTLGHAYGERLQRRDRREEPDPDLDLAREDEFVRARLAQILDLVRLVADYEPSPADETGFVGFQLGQSAHPSGGAQVGAAHARLAAAALLHAAARPTERLHPLLDALVDGYLRGRAARCLVGPRWEAMFDQPLAAVRAAYGVPPRGQGRRGVEAWIRWVPPPDGGGPTAGRDRPGGSDAEAPTAA